MRPQSHRMTETKHENRQTMDTKDTCFREKGFIFSFRDFEGGPFCDLDNQDGV